LAFIKCSAKGLMNYEILVLLDLRKRSVKFMGIASLLPVLTMRWFVEMLFIFNYAKQEHEGSI